MGMAKKKGKKIEYSKVVTTVVVSIFTVMTIAFVVFVCYEMHVLGDLSPVAYIGPSLMVPLTGVVGAYMWRAKAKSQNDLEWEKTKKLTKFREKHPEYFTQGEVQTTFDDNTGGI